ncbi:hypothetical protein HGRIS_014216 [Hohenbuehelia grisea]|uniref:Uncharacterized protein n=1 Tax=Hohenbuehelia grisea TaxID=104357 RepID=A0ABR3JUF5_9AGAR
MPSFKSLSMIAAFAFAAFAVASPVAAPEPIPVPAPVPVAAPVAELAVRGGGYKPVPLVLIELKAAIVPLAAELKAAINLHSLVSLDVQIKVVVEKIKVVIKVAIDLFKVIHEGGYPEDDYLYHDGHKYTKNELAVLLYEILYLIFGAIYFVLKLVGLLKVFIVLPLLKEIGVLVAELLSILFILVIGLIYDLLPLLLAVDAALGVSLASIIVYLGVPALTLVLGGLLGVIGIILL